VNGRAGRLAPLGVAAIEYVRRGLPVLPVGRDKRPLVAWARYQHEMPTEAQVTAWWRQWPEANIGCATGAQSGLVVFDYDSREALAFSIALGLDARTWAWRTGRGWQQAFRHPGFRVANRAGLLPDLDVRGDGGFVILPPSLHANGRPYVWITSPDDLPIADLPERARLILLSDGNGHHAPGVGADPEIIPKGQRNDALYRRARSRLARGASPETVKTVLLAENAARCVPPLDEAEVDAIVEHAATHPHAADFVKMSDDEAEAHAVGRRAKRQTTAAAPAPAVASAVASASSDAAPDEPVKSAGRGESVLAPLDVLGEVPTLEDVARALRQVSGRLAKAKADPLARAVAREGAVERLARRGVNGAVKLVDAALKGREGAPDTAQGQSLVLRDPEPWPASVEGATLLADLEAALRRFVVLPEGAAVAIALWVVFAHAHEAGDVSPLLTVSSPAMRCGKSTLRAVLGRMVPRALPTSNATPSVLFRAIEASHPTLLVDEGDTFLKMSPELRGVLNSGHTRSGAVVLRTVGDEHEPRAFSTWCPKVLVLIGKLPPTLHDRSVVIPMSRKRSGERVERLREKKLRELEPLARQAARWAREHVGELRQAEPAVPEALDDRAQDNWRPLLAIAERVGGAWPSRARAAALALSGLEGRAEEGVGVQLLKDLRELFTERAAQGKPDRLASAALADQLAELVDRPWSDWRHGKPMSPRALARLLEPFKITPQQLWVSVAGQGVNVRGYAVEQFWEAWGVYLVADEPLDPPSSTSPSTSGGHSSTSREPLEPSIHAGSSGPSGSSGSYRVSACVCPTCAQTVPMGAFAGHWAGHEAEGAE
jgi:hypothetical protein